MATANMKDIKRRIKSVESTMQITKAMELVASSKLRKAKARAEVAQPFFNALYETMCEISRDSVFTSIFTTKRKMKCTLLVVIAGDRGLAGGFNSNVLKTVITSYSIHYTKLYDFQKIRLPFYQLVISSLHQLFEALLLCYMLFLGR